MIAAGHNVRTAFVWGGLSLILAGTLVVSAPTASAVENTCRVANLTQGTPSRSNLQAAIRAADRGDRIAVTGVCIGSFTIDKDLTLVGHPTWDGAQAVLHGRGNSDRVLDVVVRVTLMDLKITGGVNTNWDPDVGDSHAGGGIRVREGGILTLNRSVVRGNRSRSEGGGIANYGTLTLNGTSSVTGNKAGGIANYGELTLNDSSSVTMNMAQTGGGIILMGGSTLRMNDHSSVRGNTSIIGGGIYADNHRGRHLPDPTIVMNDSSSVRGNTADVEGGGIALEAGSALTMNGSSSVRGNHATDDGGGIWRSYGTVNLNDAASVKGNSADHGEDDIAVPPEIDRGIHVSELPAEGLAILVFGVIAAAILIPWPVWRTTVIATITGMIGILFFSNTVGRWASGPGDTLIALAQGWSLGVAVGALLGAVVHWVKGEWWPSEGDVLSTTALALLVWVMPIPALALYLFVLLFLGLLGRLV
jgi:hypothetical protein